jgi:hypothetical protein
VNPALAAEGCFSRLFSQEVEPHRQRLKISRPLIPVAVLFVTVAVTISASAQPAPPSLKTVLSAARARIEASDERGSGRLVQVAPSGARTNTSISIEAHWFPDGLRMLVVLPSARYLLTMEQNGHAAIQVLRKGESTPIRLPADRWGDGVAGTFFSPEDFVDGQFLWSRQTLLPSQPYGARDCYVLRSEPGPGQISQYSSVTTWIDQKTGAAVHVEAAQKSGPGKEFIFYDLQQNGGVWVARQIEAKRNGNPGSSLLILDHGSGRAHLQRKDFTLIPAKSPRSTPGP